MNDLTEYYKKYTDLAHLVNCVKHGKETYEPKIFADKLYGLQTETINLMNELEESITCVQNSGSDLIKLGEFQAEYIKIAGNLKNINEWIRLLTNFGDFDLKTIFLNNLDNIVFSTPDIKVSDIENAAHVSSGYISKLRTNSSEPPARLIQAAAKLFNVTMESLCEPNLKYKKITASENKLLEFIQNLDAKTQTEENFEWHAIDNEDLDSGILDKTPIEDDLIPLFSERGTIESKDGNVYFSYFHSQFYSHDKMNVLADGYYAKIDEKIAVYLIPMVIHFEDKSVNCKEMYLGNTYNKKLEKVLNTININLVIDKRLDVLLNSIIDSTSHIQLSEEASNLIDIFNKTNS